MQGIKSYKRSSIEGATNEQLLILLVEAAIKRAENADEAMERGDRAAWVAEIHTARAIFVELRLALDHSLAPEVTAGLDRTYRWCIHHLTESSRTGDRARLAEVRRVSRVVHTTWTEAMRLVVEGGPPMVLDDEP